MGSGLILLVIVGAWLAVLVPMGLRAHDTASSNRSAERFSDAMRVLSRRQGSRSGSTAVAPDPDLDPLDPLEPDDADVETVVAARRPVSAVLHAGAALGAARGAGARGLSAVAALGDRLAGSVSRRRGSRRQGSRWRVLRRHGAPSAAPARTPAERRRRVLGVLLLVTLVLGVAGLAGPRVLLALAGVTLLLAALFVVRCRRISQAARQRREDARRRVEAARQPRVDERVVVRVVPRPARQPVVVQQPRVEQARVEEARVEQAPAVVEPTPNVRVQRPRTAAAEWQPVPVPLPTYVTKPAAPARPAAALPTRTPRPVDTTPLDDPGRTVEAPAQRRRAVGGW